MGSLLGYLVVKNIVGSTYMGGIGIFNKYGIPQEFRYTDPVEPTEVQRILFGESLDKAVRVKVVGESLIKELSVKPDFIVIDKKDMLQMNSSIPLVYMEYTQNSPLEDVGKYISQMDGFLVQIYDARSPYFVILSGKKKDISKFIDVVLEFSTHLDDILEPLRRVEGVIDYIYNTQYKL